MNKVKFKCIETVMKELGYDPDTETEVFKKVIKKVERHQLIGSKVSDHIITDDSGNTIIKEDIISLLAIYGDKNKKEVRRRISSTLYLSHAMCNHIRMHSSD